MTDGYLHLELFCGEPGLMLAAGRIEPRAGGLAS